MKIRIIKESKEKKIKRLFKPGLLEHVNTKTPLTENIFRVGSECYFNTIRQGRELYKMGLYETINEEERDMLENTELGEWAMFEGKKVPLDFPMYIEEKKKRKVKKKSGKKDACYHKVKSRYKVWPSAYASGALVKCRKVGAKNWGNSKNEEIELNDQVIGEKKAKKKNPPIGKPMKNTGGGKKYQVYVRNPKTGNVKKITYGDSKGGLKGNWNNAEARKSFAARHNCADKKDRTKSGYWACRAHKDFGTNVPGRFW
jgi:hypothetical protein